MNKQEKFTKLLRKEDKRFNSIVSFLESKLDSAMKVHSKKMKKIHNLCEKEGGHVDDGGPFYAKCKYCGFKEPRF